MTTVSSPNADIAQQARTAANRASSSSTTAKPDEQPADPFAALFDAAMMLQAEPTAVPVTSATEKTAIDTSLASDEAPGAADAPVDLATLLASMPWPAPTETAAKPADASTETAPAEDAVSGLAAATADLAAADTAKLDPASIIATPTPDPASMANLLVPANQAASGVRRAGQTLGDTVQGVQARSSASDTDADDIKTGKTGTDIVDASPPATAIEMAAAANAAASSARTAAAGGNAEANTPVAGVLAGSTTHTAAASAATAGAPAAARQDVPTVPGPPVPLHAPQLQSRVDDAVRWMSTQSIQTAQIRVTPEDMGPITVHVRMEGDVANVTFSSEHAQTRQVLEASMGGLRTALGENGLQLGQAQVGSEQQNQQAFSAFANSGGEDRRARQAAADRMQATVSALSGRSEPVAKSGNSLVDLYA
jgi:flagellar hook-length control protein FliK